MNMKKAASLFLALVLILSALNVLSACNSGENLPADGSVTVGKDDTKNTNATSGNDVTTPSGAEDGQGTEGDQAELDPNDPRNDPTYGQYYVLAKKSSRRIFSSGESEGVDYDYAWTVNSMTMFTYGDKSLYIEFDSDGYYTKIEQDYSDKEKPYHIYEYDRNALPGIEFLEKDNALNVSEYNDDEDKYYQYVKSEFDEAGRVISTTSTYSDGSIEYKYTYNYDENGNIGVVYERYNSDRTPSYVCEYDGHKNLTRYVLYTADGSVQYTDIYEYDDSGDLLCEIRQYSDTEIVTMCEYGYDTSGNLTKKTSYHRDGSIGWVLEYEYDAVGNLTRSTFDSEVQHEFEYDAGGNLLVHTDLVLVAKYEYEYDENGNLIKDTHYIMDTWYTASEDPSAWVKYDSSEYEYDGNGNLTKKATYDSDGELSKIEEYEWLPATETQYKFEQLFNSQNLDR